MLLLIIVWFVIVIGSLVMFIVAIVDIVKRPDWQWKLSGQEKILWLLVVILVNILAIPALIYWFNIRKKLIAVEAAAIAGQYGPGHMTVSGWVPGLAAPLLFKAWSHRGGIQIPVISTRGDGGMEVAGQNTLEATKHHSCKES